MGVIQLPAWRLRSQVSDRGALRQGIAASGARMRVVKSEMRLVEFCDRCAAPIEDGAIMRGTGVFCSVECSLGGPGRSA